MWITQRRRLVLYQCISAGPKVGPLAGSWDVDAPTVLVLLTGFLHNIDEASTIGSQPTFTFCLRNTKMANHAKIMQHHPPPHLLKFFFNWKPFPFWFFAFMLLVVLLVMWWCTKCGDAPNVEMPQMWRCTKCGDGFHVFKIFPWFS